jgi:hypothetical protein
MVSVEQSFSVRLAHRPIDLRALHLFVLGTSTEFRFNDDNQKNENDVASIFKWAVRRRVLVLRLIVSLNG